MKNLLFGIKGATPYLYHPLVFLLKINCIINQVLDNNVFFFKYIFILGP